MLVHPPSPRCSKAILDIVLAPFLVFIFAAIPFVSSYEPVCSAQDSGNADPNLVRQSFDIGYGEEEFDFYITPDVSTFYRESPGSRDVVRPRHPGLAGKFVNMGTEPLKLYWDPGSGQRGSLTGMVAPFMSGGTATFPRHKFFFADSSNIDDVKERFTIDPNQSVYYYDPYEVPGDEEATRLNLESLSVDDYEKYDILKRSRLFAQEYKKVTGRDYLSIYPRDKPRHYMWQADYFGQQHWVTTKETHFVQLPPREKLLKIEDIGKSRILKENEPRLLQEYRSDDPVMNMTLTVISCAPRAFEIPNFLSDVEVDHILELATGMTLHDSTVGTDGTNKADNHKTRTSKNTWVDREKSPVIDAIYRRAADLLRIDEALVRYRDGDEHPDLPSQKNIAEPLQLVHYGVGQEYTAHHDFGYSSRDFQLQSQRYATLLLYLNDDVKGGETAFPRWMNAHTGEPLKIKPKRGKAALFFSFLPDGNMDDLSQHAAIPVTEGEKWLINLWVRDPVH